MNMQLAFGAAVLFVAGGIAFLGVDGRDRVADDAASKAPARAAQPAALSAASVRLDPPPVALVCRERSAEVRVASGAAEGDFLEEFLLVSDPQERCRRGDLAERGGYDAEGGRCYTYRSPASATPDLPLVCAEAFARGEDGFRVSRIRCEGWSRRIETTDDGAFRFTIAPAAVAGTARVSEGSCERL